MRMDGNGKAERRLASDSLGLEVAATKDVGFRILMRELVGAPPFVSQADVALKRDAAAIRLTEYGIPLERGQAVVDNVAESMRKVTG
ncbi:MAG TPA: hypothetical protein VLG27_04540 [Candidatus Saccharimonadia bacterium]|nr:hypothetical protein [Candidatus Saccharimonadia bacterium]